MNPQTWNRYAYVGNNPLSLVDPLGLQWMYICEIVDTGSSEIETNVNCYWDDIGGDGGGGNNSGGEGGGHGRRKINKAWSQTFPCNKNAQTVMSAVQNDMGQFASNQGTFFGAYFPDQPITMGGQYSIQPGVMLRSANMYGERGGGVLPVANLVVTVTSESGNGWTFYNGPSAALLRRHSLVLVYRCGKWKHYVLS